MHIGCQIENPSCHDENSGNRYYDGQSWMSSGRFCAKCYCINGTADCESSVLHCQSSCLPGQKIVSTGPCCEHKCIGEHKPCQLDGIKLISWSLHCKPIFRNITNVLDDYT
ncbi:hypothetical protein TSMEX_000697 [Taenia solium]|eukprot:TsM_000233600 transcript=TsM_000233600 gene=TsM_000233600